MAVSKVTVGPTTVAGGAITLAAYAVAIVAFIQGARDEQTLSALVVGTLSLLTTLGGRYAQAVAALLVVPPAGQRNVAATITGDPAALAKTVSDVVVNEVGGGLSLKGSTFTEPRPGVSVTSRPAEPAAPYTPDGDPADEDPDEDRLAGLPDESFLADPDDKDGAKDHPEKNS